MRALGEAGKKKGWGFNNGYQRKVLLKLRLMDGLSKKIIALVGKWGCVLGEGRAPNIQRG